MGTPQFSVPALRKLIASKYDLLAVYTQPDRLAGRGRKASSPPVKETARQHGITVLQPETLKNPDELQRAAEFKPDAIVVVSFGQILPGELLDIPRFGCLNIHPSLLPLYRGPSPIASAILSGDRETGISIMLLDAGIDTGPILARQSLEIAPQDTTGSLEGKLAETGASLLMNVLPEWFEHKIIPERQDNRRATYTKQISKADGRLDWHLPAIELDRKIRAFHPWPGGYTYWKEKALKIVRSVPLSTDDTIEPGRVIALPVDIGLSAGIGTGEGILGLSVVQLEGRKAMPITDFLRGQPGFIGEKLI